MCLKGIVRAVFEILKKNPEENTPIPSSVCYFKIKIRKDKRFVPTQCVFFLNIYMTAVT